MWFTDPLALEILKFVSLSVDAHAFLECLLLSVITNRSFLG